ncbi:MAG: hypothetical protein KGL39_04660 [Patescibacteria group bacterium]|nr:hypothetical protein [Patescibacteria group bacterium]
MNRFATSFGAFMVVCLFIGCAAQRANEASGPPRLITQSLSGPTCLPMPVYTAAQQKELASEWSILRNQHPTWITTQRFIADAVKLRGANRAACGH